MITVPLRTKSGMNARELWQARSRRVKKERHAVAWMLKTATKPPIPCSVRLWRIGPTSGLDDDNLASALKGVRDEIAEWLGVNDRDRTTVRYAYDQKRGPEWCVQIEFGAPVAGAQFNLLEQA